jgi:UDP-N-acetylmuramoyl-tripeptide--D-alanyl-D-alanine ligase
LSGAWLIDDSYNANPSSMRAGIDVLAELEGRKWLVIGDMAELGDYSHSAHAEVGAYARERGIERVYATGPLSARAVESFGAGAQWFADSKSLAEALALASPEVRILIKGSRVNRLERVVEVLVGSSGYTGGH